jgi:hypothetical protein
LEVAGKRSGRTVTFALRMAERNGRCYLVPMLEADCNWVRNVRAIDGRVILRRGKRTARLLVEIPTPEISPSTLPSEERMPGPQLQTAALAHPGRV